MDWIHCNSCYLLPTQSKGKKFSLTSCGHVYCENCVKPDDTKKCAICGNTFNMIPLTSELSADIQEYFKTPEDILKRALQIMTFQDGHRSRITAYFNNVVLKYKAAKQEIMRLNGIIKKQEKDYKDLKQQNMFLKQKLQRGMASFTHSNSSSNINSQVQCSKSSEPNVIPSQMKSATAPTLTNMNSEIPADRITFSQGSKISASQMSPWITPRRLTLRKVTSPSSCSSSLGNTNLPMFSPITPRNTFNYSAQYRTNTQYSSQPNTPSTPGTPITPERYLDTLFLVNVFKGKINYHSIMYTIGIRVPARQIR
ncbi:RING finger protein 212B-like [Zootermopsis nevadensis]|uniref:RING finger protein 212B-like n=1 Tax=Zootermopsis nevadensis TaxID=136037 RepID=UPI000B8ED867|nr:RING finger protein 212B-like [Zootermopsis nevadensis]